MVFGMEHFDDDASHRPIVVGYAFGAKKMRSMGMVMAEASKALFYPPSIHELEDDLQEIVVIDLEKKQKLHQVVRHFQQSCCSSVEGGDANSSAGGLTTTTISDQASGLAVSFVPLDPDIPIEEQHCGKIDVILHKLTEDILAWEDNDRASKRVERLLNFCATSQCQLVDDPRAVRTVLSRAEIATRLVSLKSLATVSGIPISTPFCSTTPQHPSLRYPVIAKPLTAAGTKASHSMKVLLRRPSCDVAFQEPMLFQEYVNHDAVLYKIYVLGDDISVFERTSLPNLPKEQTSTLDAVEFDSQRHPYPCIKSFGFDPAASACHKLSERIVLTADEIRPVVMAMKQAFRLELFGFDIIYGENKLWIVDVNYFPSYKEVSHFPALLAKYLTDMVLAKRQQDSNESTEYER